MGKNLIISLMKEEYENHLKKVIQESLKVFGDDGKSTISRDTKVTHKTGIEYTVSSIKPNVVEPNEVEPGSSAPEVKITLRRPEVPRPPAVANAKKAGIPVEKPSDDDYFVIDLKTFESEYDV